MKNASLRETATASLKQIGDRVSEIRDKAGDFMLENTEAARERMAEAYEDARKRVASGVRTTRFTVRRHPLESVAVAFGVGLIIGTLSGILTGRRR
jgi:ElaB/YqjD/DUF883 family membrane-anchored ribosome-binding protein